MKKLIAITLTLPLIFTLIVPASAATTMHWDWGKAQSSIGKAITEIVQEQHTEPTEILEAEYELVEGINEEIYTGQEYPEWPKHRHDWLYWWNWWK